MTSYPDDDECDSPDGRLTRLERMIGQRVMTNGRLPLGGPLIAVTCSRLGVDPKVHRELCRFLTRSMLDCRQRGGVVLIADGSAIDPWATRAAEIFGVAVIRVFVKEADCGDEELGHFVVRSPDEATLSRDQVVIALADRVDAIHVRYGGRVFDALRQRVRNRMSVRTRVSISSSGNKAALALVDEGAIGWYCSSETAESPKRDHSEGSKEIAIDPTLDWACSEGKWLVHSTRACDGPWPGETLRQYQDSMLLSNESSANRTAFDALARIVRYGKLFGSAIATDRRFPVVCFSAASLRERLQSRCYRPHLKRWDCEPYGVAIRVTAAKKLGATSVVYGGADDRKLLAPQDQYRFQAKGKTYDWTSEREWRMLGEVDLAACDPHDVRVFVPTEADARRMGEASFPHCPWKISCVSPLFDSDAIIPSSTISSSTDSKTRP